ncbi:hypothetical protein CRUP_005300, partial [Coryphaenoides rupestris]
MAEDELTAFRRSWERELRESGPSTPGGDTSTRRHEDPDGEPGYVSIASSLLDGRTSPLRERLQKERMRKRKRQQHITTTEPCRPSSPQQTQKKEKLVDQLIQDLNEMNDIPFFDVDLPYELALKIFQYLDCAELGRCAQVSKEWAQLAEDEVLWFRLCRRAGFRPEGGVGDS